MIKTDLKPLTVERDGKIINLKYAKEAKVLISHLDSVLEKENKIFWIDKENFQAIQDIFLYMFNDKEFETGDRLLSKSLIIIGNVGSGKTMLMKGISRLLSGYNTFRFVTCKTVKQNWLNSNSNLIPRLYHPFKEGGKNHICFDDLGAEEPISEFGPIVEPMEHVIDKRNELWVDRGVKTHFTMNLSLNEHEDRYGERTSSRFTQMGNVIYLGKESDSLNRRIQWKR